MKTKLFSLAMLLFSLLSFSQVLDTTFGEGGKTIVPYLENVNGVYLQQDGKLLAVGKKSSTNNFSTIVRLKNDGNLDINFGEVGKVDLSNDILVNKIVCSSNGGFIARTQKSSNGSPGFLKFLPNGVKDSSFNTTIPLNGGVSGSVFESNSIVDFDLTSDGKILLIHTSYLSNTPGGGMPSYYQSRGSLYRLNQDGSTDITIGLHNSIGAYSSELKIPAYGNLTVEKSTGEFYVAKGNQYSSPDVVRVINKYDSNGSQLWSFEDSSIFIKNMRIKSLNGALYSSGLLIPKTFVRKLIGTSPISWQNFQIDNYATSNPDSNQTLGTGILIQNDGKVIQTNLRRLTENEAYKLQLVRFNTDGTLDNSFGNNAIFLIDGVKGWSEYDPNIDRFYVTSSTYIYRYNQNLLSTSEIKKDKISVYPNPAKTTINFSKEIKSAEIYSLDGRKMINNIQGKTADLSKLEKGTYLIKGIDKEGNTFSEKVIKN